MKQEAVRSWRTAASDLDFYMIEAKWSTALVRQAPPGTTSIDAACGNDTARAYMLMVVSRSERHADAVWPGSFTAEPFALVARVKRDSLQTRSDPPVAANSIGRSSFQWIGHPRNRAIASRPGR
jgi:hypothetical protein